MNDTQRLIRLLDELTELCDEWLRHLNGYVNRCGKQLLDVIASDVGIKSKPAKHDRLCQVPRKEWPTDVPEDIKRIEVWLSYSFLVQIFSEQNGIERMSVCRTEREGHSWKENITWDDLQNLKNECGRGKKDAVELYPADKDVVNVANMRHLWIMPQPVSFVWRIQKCK